VPSTIHQAALPNGFRQLLDVSLSFLMPKPVGADLSTPTWYQVRADCTPVSRELPAPTNSNCCTKWFNVATVVKTLWRK